MNKISTLFTAAAAVTMLALSPVSAQQTGGDTSGGGGAEVEAQFSMDDRMRSQVYESFRTLNPAPVTVAFDPVIGATVPATVTLQPVPAEIVTVAPDVEAYHYFALPDGRIALVHPDSRQIVYIIEG